MTEPREWWIADCKFMPDRAFNSYESAKCMAGCSNDEIKHVIEYSAYQALEEKLRMAEQFIQSWAWTGSNGSPYTEEQAKRLQSLIQNDAWKTYKQIFEKNP